MGRRLVQFILIFLFVTCCVTDVPPLGDAECFEDSCDNANCAGQDCSFGKLMDSPSSPCGCCKLCVNYIVENKTCNLLDDKKECGPGLICKPNGSSNICVKMNTRCFQAQAEYDVQAINGTIGMYEVRPACDANGDYVARRCQPGSSCHCIDVNGNRIFGESPPDSATNDVEMNCECSRMYELAAKQISYRNLQYPHCLPNGNFDSLQCVHQACFCIDPFTRSITSSIQPITAITDLPCYTSELHTPNYFRPCEVVLVKIKRQLNSFNRQNITIIGLQQPECSPDGYYKPLRRENSKLYCANPFGEKIENFEVLIDSQESIGMDCKCARTRYWLRNQNIVRPSCCKNGNYRPMQCRGGVCFCVDTDGNQVGTEVKTNDITSLECYNSNQNPFC